MNLCILGVTFDTGNMGVSALSEGVMQCILKHFPKAKVTFLGYGRGNGEIDFNYNGKLVRIKKVNMRFSKNLYLKNNIVRLILESIILRAIRTKRLKERFIGDNYYLRSIIEANIVASIAGGDSLSDIYGIEQFLYVALPQVLCIILGKKIVQLPQTYGPCCGAVTKFIYKYILKNSNPIYSRDYEGVMEIRRLMKVKDGETKVRFSHDVGFIVEGRQVLAMDFDQFGSKYGGRLLVGLNISGLLYREACSERNRFKLKVHYGDLIKRLVGIMVDKWGADVVLVPHVFGSNGANCDIDEVICEEIYETLKAERRGRIFFLKGRYDHKEIKFIIGNCDFFVGSRMHACIAALSQNIPTVPIAYSKKFVGVMETVGMERYVADPRVMEDDQIIELIENAWKNKEEICRKLKDEIPEVRSGVFALFKDIGCDLGFSGRDR